MRVFTKYVVALAMASGLIIGCDRQASDPKNTATPSADQAAVPTDFVRTTEPAGARDLAEVKSSVKDGDDVVVRAVVGGSEEPFISTRAVVQIIDPSVKTCNQTPGDGCKTPWDACCDQDGVKAKGATVQVVDADGKPVAGTLHGVGGLKPSSQIVIVGKAKMEGPALLINATGIYLKP